MKEDTHPARPPQGAKNEVLQIICATLLTAEEVTVHNIPDILDVNNLIQLMRDMGVTVSRKGLDTYCFKAEKLDLSYLESDEFLKKWFQSARFGHGALPDGCMLP